MATRYTAQFSPNAPSGTRDATPPSRAAAPEADQVIRAQELRDLRAARDDLERRVHDLKLTR